MNRSAALGLLLIAGFVAGAFIMSSVGREKPQEQDLAPVTARIDAIANRLHSLEERIADLNERLEQTLAAIEANSESVSELRGQLAAGKGAEGSEEKDKKLAQSKDGYEEHLETGVHPMLDKIKEAIKKELKKENIAEKKQKGVQSARKWVEWQTQSMRKKLDNDFVRLAEKIGLDRNQELAARDITEEVLRQLKTLWTNWADRLADADDEVWGEFKGEIGGVYENAHQQLQRHVSEEQAKAIMRFIQEGGK
jgi:hypothetical protein